MIAEIQHTASQLSPRVVEEMEASMLSLPQVECPVTHSFGNGIYIREVRIPAGTFAIGHHQNQEHANYFLEGKVTVLKDDGTTELLCAPMAFIGKPGRKIGYVHEDVVWLNVYETNEQDVEKLEATYLTKSDTFLLAAPQIKALENGRDNEDYKRAIAELGFSADEVDKVAFSCDDIIPLPPGSYGFKTAPSPIHGTGVFATRAFSMEDELVSRVVGPARLAGKRTALGRFTNHSANPNAEMISVGEDIYLVATREIAGCRGGMNGEEITVDYRNAVIAAAKAINL